MDRLADFFTFHHMGLLTRLPEAAVGLLRSLGYQVGPETIDPLQQVALRMACPENGSSPNIELVTPLEGNERLANLLKTKSDFIYHLCYTVPETARAVALMNQPGSRAIEVSPPKPAVLFEGRRVSFYLAPGLGLVELLERRAL